MNFSLSNPNPTKTNMLLSAGLSCAASLLFNRGNPIAMAAVGATAALIHACVLNVFQRYQLDTKAANHIPHYHKVKKPLKAVLSVVLTGAVMGLLGGPAFSIARTAIMAVGASLLFNTNYVRLNNLAIISIA